MNKRLLSVAIVVLGILAVTFTAILLAKGYRFDRGTGTIRGTGIIAVSSIPQGAGIYLDGELASASNNAIRDLSPKTYQVKISKDGFSNWEKAVLVEAEKVALIDVVLFPITPDLRPLTFTGVSNPQLSSDGQKVVYASSDPNKAGLWVLDMSNRPFTFSRDPKQIAKDTVTFRYSKANFSWAPDSKTVLVTAKLTSGKNVAYLLDIEQLTESPTDVGPTIDQTKAVWQSDLELKNKDRLSQLTEVLKTQVESSAKVRWSPDELKVAWEKDGVVKAYDLKKDGLAEIGNPKDFFWYPDNGHLILVEDGTISIVEADGTNKTSIYGGGFEDSLVFPWPDGSKLVILATLNKAAGANLYSISLR